MRTFRVLAVVFAVVMFVAPSTTFAAVSSGVSAIDAPSKVCHPKKPVTCRATDLTAIATEEPASLEIAPAAKQQAMICYGPRWNCKANTLGNSKATEPKPAAVKSAPVTKQAMICYGPRWNCKAATLG